jgi:hypothetical protein
MLPFNLGLDFSHVFLCLLGSEFSRHAWPVCLLIINVDATSLVAVALVTG